MIEAPTRAYFTVRNYRLTKEGKPTTVNRFAGRPLTGRCTSSIPIPPLHPTNRILPAHQIRVHLQYLGHPIANDPVYSETKIWARSFHYLNALKLIVCRDQTSEGVVLTRHHQTNARRQLYLPT
jgi:hypothetical protein